MKHFITGAGSGIGAAVAAALHARGDELMMLSRTKDRAEELAARFPDATLLVADLANPWALESALAAAVLPATLDTLLLIAGIARRDTVAALDASQVSAQIEVNLVSPMLLTRALLPALRQRRGHVVLANSTACWHAKPGWAAYASSKSGLRAFADSLRVEEQQNGVRVTSLYLGRTATPMQESVHAQEGWTYDPSLWIQPETVAQAVTGVLDVPPDAAIPEVWITPNGGACATAAGQQPRR
jgi:short-subunit dehydrogenase